MEREIHRENVDADPVLVGSVAKGTHLKNADIDIFIRFSQKYSRKDMENIGLKIARRVLPNGFAKYAEHPYIRGNMDGYNVDLVPCYRIKNVSEKISSVDRTPLHTEYIKKSLKKEQRDEVRLLKTFLKGIGIYGSEARVQGFSGYLCELLVVKYGSFLDVLKNVARWRRRVYLYIEKPGKKFRDPVVFIDPVDPNRNVASVVSEFSKSMFIFSSSQFLENPNLNFFFPKRISAKSTSDILEKIRKRGTKIYVFEFPRVDVIDDILYPQIRKTEGIILKILKDFLPVNSFTIVDNEKIYFVVEFERDKLPRIKRHEGPPVWHENSKNFIEKWKKISDRGPYISDSRLYVEILRDKTSIEDVFFNQIDNYKLGKHFEKVKHNIKVEPIEKVLSNINTEDLTRFFFYRFPWEW